MEFERKNKKGIHVAYPFFQTMDLRNILFVFSNKICMEENNELVNSNSYINISRICV